MYRTFCVFLKKMLNRILISVIFVGLTVNGCFIPGNCDDNCMIMFERCINNCTHNCNIEFDRGIFGFNKTININGKQNIHFYGSIDGESKIIMHGLHSFFVFNGCDNITINNLYMDTYRVPFTLGKVVSIDKANLKFTLSYDNSTLYPFPGSNILNDGQNYEYLYNIQAILGYDINKNRFNYPDIYTSTTKIVSVNNETLIIECVTSESNVINGININDSIIIRHQVYSFNGMSFYSNNNINISNIYLLSTPGMGFFYKNNTNITMNNVHIFKYNNRPMSITADATHFQLNKGYITIQNCLFEGQGDDGMNLHNYFFQINKTISSNQLLLQTKDPNTKINSMMSIGDLYRFRNRHTLQPYFSSKLLDISAHNIATFEDNIPSEMNIYDVISSITSLPTKVSIINNIWRASRARGTLIKIDNVSVINNTYQDITGPAIFIRPESAYWLESTSSNNIIISKNNINNCNYGPATQNGTITITATVAVFNNGIPTTQEAPLLSGQVHHNFTITNNIINDNSDSNLNHAIISIRAADNFTITDNIFVLSNDKFVAIQELNDGIQKIINPNTCKLSDGSSTTCIVTAT